jgi:queuine/archaeosine tRNA-ribosyltransferase
MSEEILAGLSVAELEALADELLAPARQARLDELLSKNGQCSLDDPERHELDRLLDSADQLTLLKNRARYTLNQLNLAAAES